MEHLWSIFGGRAEKQLVSFRDTSLLLLGENDKKWKRKSPHRQGFTRNCLREWGELFIHLVCSDNRISISEPSIQLTLALSLSNFMCENASGK